jgi:hypothetical protein
LGWGHKEKQKGSRPERRERRAEPFAIFCKQNALIVPALLSAGIAYFAKGKIIIPIPYLMQNAVD